MTCIHCLVLCHCWLMCGLWKVQLLQRCCCCICDSPAALLLLSVIASCPGWASLQLQVGLVLWVGLSNRCSTECGATPHSWQTSDTPVVMWAFYVFKSRQWPKCKWASVVWTNRGSRLYWWNIGWWSKKNSAPAVAFVVPGLTLINSRKSSQLYRNGNTEEWTWWKPVVIHHSDLSPTSMVCSSSCCC